MTEVISAHEGESTAILRVPLRVPLRFN